MSSDVPSCPISTPRGTACVEDKLVQLLAYSMYLSDIVIAEVSGKD